MAYLLRGIDLAGVARALVLAADEEPRPCDPIRGEAAACPLHPASTALGGAAAFAAHRVGLRATGGPRRRVGPLPRVCGEETLADALPRFVRLPDHGRASVPFTIDGIAVTGLEGDTLLSAILAVRPDLGTLAPDPRRRAGFCLIGACQDCWIRLADGPRVRACTTPLVPGMAVLLEADGERW